MDLTAEQIRNGGMWPAGEPFDRRMLDRDNGHRIHVEQCGNPRGRPVIVLHGGPGGGCSPYMRRFFDPRHWRVVLFDQRGCGRSTPHAVVEANTTRHLIGDIEAIRAELDLGPVTLFGGSWGATLALAHAQAHPEAVEALILRGVFLARRQDVDWFYGGGAARFFPDLWAGFCAPIPPEERHDMVAAYHRRLFSGDRAQEIAHARIWTHWENALSGLHAPLNDCGIGAGHAHAFARLECHYFRNGCFLDEGQLLRDLPRIAHLPAVIVHGRQDVICPPAAGYALADRWPAAQLRLVSGGGHAMSEPAIAAELLRAVQSLAIRPELH